MGENRSQLWRIINDTWSWSISNSRDDELERESASADHEIKIRLLASWSSIHPMQLASLQSRESAEADNDRIWSIKPSRTIKIISWQFIACKQARTVLSCLRMSRKYRSLIVGITFEDDKTETHTADTFKSWKTSDKFCRRCRWESLNNTKSRMRSKSQVQSAVRMKTSKIVYDKSQLAFFSWSEEIFHTKKM